MKGLLYKEFLLLRKIGVLYIYLPIILILPLSTPNLMMVMFPCFFAAMLPMTLLSLDERSRFDQYSQTFPVTRAMLVHIKYIMGLCLTYHVNLKHI